MCIPRGIMSSKSNSFVKKRKPKHIDKPNERMMKSGDPDFVDERIIKEDKKSLIERILEYIK